MIPKRLPLLTTAPRGTTASFDPQIVRQRLRRLTDIDEMVLPLTARELNIGEVAGAHIADVIPSL
jgi:hypothetical protein